MMQKKETCGNGIGFELLPEAQVRCIEQRKDGSSTWEALGFDSCFICHLEGGLVEGGWYECDLDLTAAEDRLFDPVLYPDYGQGRSEINAIPLPFAAEPAIKRFRVVRFLGSVKSLRLDPTSMLGTFQLGSSGRFRRIGKSGAAIRMLRALMRITPGMGRKLSILRTVVLRLCSGGPRYMADWLYWQYKLIGSSQKRFDVNYQSWLRLYDVPMPERSFEREPKISIVLPVYNTEERWLSKCIESVIGQRYSNWELCICNDASTRAGVREVLDRYASMDDRIKVVHREKNGHISAASNDALNEAAGEYVGLLDHDDELHHDALYEVAAFVNDHPDVSIIFSDEDKMDQYGVRFDPYFKPDWNPDLFLGHNCISHFGVYQRELIQAVGGFRIGMEGSQDWDLALRCIEQVDATRIGHIHRVLYHWRAIPGSTALAPGEKNYAHVAGLRAVNEHLARIGVDAQAFEIDGRRGNYRVRYALPSEPSVTIIIPTRDRADLLERCVQSIFDLTRYDNYRLIIMDNQSAQVDALQLLADLRSHPKVEVVAYDSAFNYSAINNHAVRLTTDDVIVLLNNDIEVISVDWLTELVANAIRPEVGAVGAMLLYPNDTIQHAGVVLGVHGVAAHAYSGKPRGWPGQMNRGGLAQNYSAVTAACLAVRREVFLEVEGLSEDLRVAFNDIDFCLKLRSHGYWNVWLPWVEMYHHESATRGYEDTAEKRARFGQEISLMMQRWPTWLASDPAYNQNLAIDGDPFMPSYPPRYMRNILVTEGGSDFIGGISGVAQRKQPLN